MFCPKCGAILRPKKMKGKNILSCSCGHSAKDAKAEIKEVIQKEKEIEIIQEGQKDQSLPITDAKCPDCGNDKARYWLQQMRSGDEPETKFMKCTKCKHIWRDNQ
ncbi:transcription factor S [Nanoarchaeota archaeon]